MSFELKSSPRPRVSTSPRSLVPCRLAFKFKGLLVLSTIALIGLPISLSMALSADLPGLSDGSFSNPTLLAQKSRTRRIQFAPGKDYAIVNGAVIRGTRDIYLLDAQQRQTLTVKVESIESNAVFDLVAPPNRLGQRRTFKQEAVSWSGNLPETGDYQIVVGPTRGNATYRLKVIVQ